MAAPLARHSTASWGAAILIVAFALSSLWLPSANASTSNANFNAGQYHVSKNVTSFHSRKQQNIIMQQHDYSCGAAALATLMSYHYNDPTSEQSLLELAKSLSIIDQRVLKEKGLSLLNLKQLAEEKGYRAIGVRLTLEHLAQLRGPVLIYYQPRDYEHFAVLKGLRGDRVYLADPIRGNVRTPLYRFTKDWDGIALVLDKPNHNRLNSQLQLPQSSIRPELRAAQAPQRP